MLRKLQITDAEFLCSIFRDNKEYYNIFFDSETNVEKWEQRIARFLSHDEWKHFIIVEDGIDIGWFAYEALSEFERGLIIIVVKPELLKRGYGSKVFSEFLKTCKEESVKTVFLNVNANNARAIAFYEKFGFRVYDKEIIPESNDKTNNEELKMKLEL